MIDIDISLRVDQQEIPPQFRGQFTTMERALKTADALKQASGGVVHVVDESLQCPSPVPHGLAFITLYFADGRSVNAALAEFKLANDPNLANFDLGNASPVSGPRGVSYKCSESQYHIIRQALADTKVQALAPSGGGVLVNPDALDTAVERNAKLPAAMRGPVGATYNYVIELAGGIWVNAAFIGRMLSKYSAEGAMAFARTRGAK